MENNLLKRTIEERLNCKVIDISEIGSGASACIFKVSLDKAPYVIAVKYSEYPDLLIDEFNTVKFISDRVECKLPKLYDFIRESNFALIVMEYIDGKSATFKNLRFKLGKKKLADEIIDNLLKIHSVHNDKFGPIDNAVYNTWYDYYNELAAEIYQFTAQTKKDNKIPEIVFKAVENSYKNLPRLIEKTNNKPTLIHGDYWVPNFLVNTKTMELTGIVDPFNVMWTEPEYELFALTVGYGKNLRLYENYKSKVNVSSLCDLKVELYALYNELYWFKKLGKVSVGYLVFRSRRLLKQMKKNKIT